MPISKSNFRSMNNVYIHKDLAPTEVSLGQSEAAYAPGHVAPSVHSF